MNPNVNVNVKDTNKSSNLITIFARCRQGEEWHRHRSVLSKKMLRPQEVVAYCRPMNDVADDFIDHLKKLRTADGLIPDMEMQFFRWALECTSVVGLGTSHYYGEGGGGRG